MIYYKMPRTEAQKKAQQKWIEKNKDTYIEKQRIASANYYLEHREEVLQRKKIYYQNKKAMMKQEDNEQINI